MRECMRECMRGVYERVYDNTVPVDRPRRDASRDIDAHRNTERDDPHNEVVVGPQPASVGSVYSRGEGRIDHV
jgi:hypothetical protein